MKQAPFERKLGKARIAGGLAWTPMMGETAPKVREEFRRHLKASNAAWGAVAGIADQQRYAMAGVVSQAKGGPPPAKFAGAVPAAIWFATSGSHPRAYVEKVGGGLYWLLVSLASDVDPRTDQVLSRGDLTAVIHELSHEVAVGGQELSLTVWPSTAEMPEDIDFGGVVEAKPLESCLMHSAMPSVQIRKHVGVPPWVGRAAVGCAALAVVAYGANNAYEARQARLEAQQLAALEAERLERERRAREAAEGGKSDSRALLQGGLEVALGTPSPAALVESCLQLASDLPELAGGWRLASVMCDAGGASRATYDQQTGVQGLATQESFSQAMDLLGLPYSYDWFARTASVRPGSIELASRQPPEIGDLPDAKSAGTWWASYATRAQATFQGVRITIDGRAEQADAENPSPYVSRGVQIAGSATWQMGEVIPEQANLALHSITLTAHRQSAWGWSAVGALYHLQESL